MNKRAFESLNNTEIKGLTVIPGAGHLFKEACKIEEIALIAASSGAAVPEFPSFG
jgi:hypothetical protein